VLQIPPQKLRRTQRAVPALLRLRVGVTEHHTLVIGSDDAAAEPKGSGRCLLVLSRFGWWRSPHIVAAAPSYNS
jgi:hypothetical protein